MSAARTKASALPCTSQVAASSIRAAASPPANIATESRVSSVGARKAMRQEPTELWVKNWGA